MRIEDTEVDGWRTCARSRVEHGHCPGYNSEPCRVIVQTVYRTFGDSGAPLHDPYYGAPSSEHTYVLPLPGEEPRCAHCGGPANLSLERRATYPRVSDQHPDTLLERLAAQRVHESQVIDVGERQAAALEAIAAAGQENAELRAQIAALTARIESGNGHEDDVAPTPTRKAKSA